MKVFAPAPKTAIQIREVGDDVDQLHNSVRDGIPARLGERTRTPVAATHGGTADKYFGVYRSRLVYDTRSYDSRGDSTLNA